MNEQNDFSQYIDIYINEEKTDYSILINAPWGAGKTHFVKKYCNKKSDIKSDEYDENNYIYFSLKGISDIEQLINSIYLRILLRFKTEKKNWIGEMIENLNFDKLVELSNNRKLSTIYKSVSLLSSVTMPSYIEKYLINSENKTILFLDDLERVSEKINTEDLLGELDTRFIEKGIKIIYIANESELNEKHQKIYCKIKEKYIRRTYSFYPNKSDIFRDFLEDFSLENESDLFDTLLSNFSDERPNLRTVKYCCALYKELLKVSKSFPQSNNYQPVIILLPSICEYAKFITNNNISKEIILKHCPDEYKFIQKYLAATYTSQPEETNLTKEKTEEDKCKDFFDKYISDDSTHLYTNKFLIDFIFDGYLNKVEFEKTLKIEIQKEDPLNILVHHVYDYEFNTIKDNVYKVYKKIKNKEYSIDELNLLTSSFLPLAIKILQLEDVTNDSDLLIEEINKELSNIENKKEELRKRITQKTYEIITKEISNSIFSKNSEKALTSFFEYKATNTYYKFPVFTDDFNKQIEEKFNRFIFNKNIQNADKIFKAIKTAEYSEIFSQIDEYKIFSMLKESNKLDKLLTLPNKSIQFLIKYINSKILGRGNAYQLYMTEITTLEELQQLIAKKIDDKNPDFIKNDLLKQLAQTIEEAIKHIRNSKNFH